MDEHHIGPYTVWVTDGVHQISDGRKGVSGAQVGVLGVGGGGGWLYIGHCSWLLLLAGLTSLNIQHAATHPGPSHHALLSCVRGGAGLRRGAVCTAQRGTHPCRSRLPRAAWRRSTTCPGRSGERGGSIMRDGYAHTVGRQNCIDRTPNQSAPQEARPNKHNMAIHNIALMLPPLSQAIVLAHDTSSSGRPANGWNCY